MFKPREVLEAGHGGPVTVAAALSRAQATAAPSRPRRLAQLRERLAALDQAPDLAEDIGSAQWFRALGTMLALIVLALAFTPDFS